MVTASIVVLGDIVLALLPGKSTVRTVELPVTINLLHLGIPPIRARIGGLTDLFTLLLRAILRTTLLMTLLPGTRPCVLSLGTLLRRLVSLMDSQLMSALLRQLRLSLLLSLRKPHPLVHGERSYRWMSVKLHLRLPRTAPQRSLLRWIYRQSLLYQLLRPFRRVMPMKHTRARSGR